MSTLTPSQLRKRAELSALGYEPTESPAKDVLHEVTSREFEDGVIDFSPIAPGSPTPAGLRLRGYYPPTRQLFDVSDRIYSLSFNEETGQAAIQGSLTLDNTDGSAALYMNRPGMTLLLDTRHSPAVPFVERYRWVAWETSVTDLNEGQVVIDFYDFLYYIATAECSVGYVQDGSHKRGWLAHEIAADMFRKFKIPVGHLVATTYHIPTFILQDTTIYDAVAIAYTIDRHMTGNQYFIVSEKGRISVIRSNGLLGLQGKRLSKREKFVISTNGLNARPGATFRRSLDEYAAGIIPQGGDANLVQGNIKGHVDAYALPEGGRQDRKSAQAIAKLNTKEKAIAEQAFPEDPLASTNPGATQSLVEKPGTNKQHQNQLIASALLFGALQYQVHHGIPSVSDPAYTARAAQLLSNALGRAQKTITVTIDGNILLRVGMVVYSDMTFSSGKALRKQIYIQGLSHSMQNGDYTMQVTLAWRESEVSTEQDFSQVTSNAESYKPNENPGATNSGQGGTGTGVGEWITTEASEYVGSGEGSFGDLQSPGYHYAELGTATQTGLSSGQGYLARALGLTEKEVPNGFKIEISYGGKTVFATKADRGEGSGSPSRSIDLYAPSGVCGALGFKGLGQVKVRPAQ